MANILKQSTQIKVRIGPAVAVGDGFTPVTTLTLSGADEAELLKANGAATVDISAATFAAVTGSDGWYDLTLTTSHTDTVGELVVVINDDSLILPIFARFQVMEEATYDALFGASAAGFDANGRVDVGSWLGTAVTTSATSAKPEMDVYSISDDATAANNAELMFDGTGYAGGTTKLQVDAVAISSDTTAADNLELITEHARGVTINATGGTGGKDADDLVDDVWDEVVTGAAHNVNTSAAKYLREGAESSGVTATAQAGATSTITLAAGADANDDFYNGERVSIIEGTGVGQSRLITDYNGTTKVATIDRNWTTTPDATSVYSIIGAESDVRAVDGNATAADNMLIVFATDFATNYSTANDKWQVEASVSGTVTANVTQINGNATAASNAEIVFATDFATNYSTTTDKWQVEANVLQIEGADATDTINAQCDAAIVTYGLDHLVSATVTGTDIVDNSIIARLVSADATTTDWDDYDQTTDSLQAIGDRVANISSDTILNVNGLISDGSVVILFQGESRNAAGGNEITLEVNGDTGTGGVDLTGHTPKLGLTKLVSTTGSASLEVSGTLNNAGLATQSFTFALTKAQTAALAVSGAINKYAKTDATKGYAYRWEIASTDAGTDCPTFAAGYFDVRARGTTC